jgi:ureidoglycolate hydrolase
MTAGRLVNLRVGEWFQAKSASSEFTSVIPMTKNEHVTASAGNVERYRALDECKKPNL